MALYFVLPVEEPWPYTRTSEIPVVTFFSDTAVYSAETVPDEVVNTLDTGHYCVTDANGGAQLPHFSVTHEEE